MKTPDLRLNYERIMAKEFTDTMLATTVETLTDGRPNSPEEAMILDVAKAEQERRKALA